MPNATKTSAVSGGRVVAACGCGVAVVLIALVLFMSMGRPSGQRWSGMRALDSSSDRGEEPARGACESPAIPSYPQAPPGWTVVHRRKVGPFTVHVTYRREDGGTTEWHSRAHRKGASLLSRAGAATGWWAPRRASWWIAVLFAIG